MIHNYNPLPKRLVTILKKYHKGGVTQKDCLHCSSPCCNSGGFAILENVELIYQRYKQGDICRRDFKYKRNLSFEEFVRKYFDVFVYNVGRGKIKREILFFHMRHVTQDNDLISLRSLRNYWQERAGLFRDNPWLSKGCVFLSKKISGEVEKDKVLTRHCLLHREESSTHLTEKPIDCLFFTCTRPTRSKVPLRKSTAKWFFVLSKEYPDSIKRFEKLIKK